MAQIVPVAELLQMADHALEPSPWLVIDQGRIDRFAEATEDRQFIHVDPERAARTPFGSTIAHGFLTLSLLPHLAESIAVVPEGLVMGVNYGLNSLRFLQPVPVGSAVRLRLKILGVTAKGNDRLLVTSEAVIEIRDEARPALLAETLALYVVAPVGNDSQGNSEGEA